MDHIGIDVHKRESQIYILAEGSDVIEQRIRTEPERFAAVRGAGPAPDGRAYDLVSRARQAGDLATLVEKSPLFLHGLWTAYAPRSFAQFLGPWELPEARPDEARVATIVEGSTPDAEMASFVFIEERGAGRLLFGGFFADGSSLALMTLVEPAAALAALDASGLFTPGSLRTRPLVHIV